ncbi:MAG: CbiX/SirB N-terminal domain-containing protein [Rhodocyclaceae bacterium]|jgi:sirohydrochlorin cobaltochelatase|nr:CbiX/SirB N-terminal domain-containing protein [Rhodocyclaceae bacterium]
MTTGIILFGHGARNPEWAEPFQRIRAAILRSAPQTPVELGFLELMQPSLDEAIDRLVQGGVGRISIVPIFMAAGSHVKKDLPQRAANAMDRHPGLTIDIAAPVGEATSVIDAMAAYALNPG